MFDRETRENIINPRQAWEKKVDSDPEVCLPFRQQNVTHIDWVGV